MIEPSHIGWSYTQISACAFEDNSPHSWYGSDTRMTILPRNVYKTEQNALSIGDVFSDKTRVRREAEHVLLYPMALK